MLENEIKEKEKEFYKFIVSEYLRYGSVDEVFRANNYDLPISYPGVHHLIDRWGIVKAAGPNTSLTESISFLVRMVEEKIPLEKLYKRMPPSFSTSMATLHRMYRDVKKQVKTKIEERTLRRTGVALVITPKGNKERVLLGKDISTPRLDLGKSFGSVSLPMGYSKKKEERETSILRVLQQEVFAREAVNQKMPSVIPSNPRPFMFVDVADVRVAIFHLEVDKNLNFSSYKLKNHKFIAVEEINADNLGGKEYRTGVVEAVLGFKECNRTQASLEKPIYMSSHLNLSLTSLFLD